MKANVLRVGGVAFVLLSCVLTFRWSVGTKGPGSGSARAKNGTSWDQKAAATYLDGRESWWMAWPRAARDHGTFCVSCHTAVPYAISRSALRTSLGEHDLSPNEQKLIDNVRTRVRLWKEVAPFYSDATHGQYKTVESRGTESVLNALILASNDSASGRLTSDTQTAFDNMWAEQQTTGNGTGAWLWLRFSNEPWEADDSDFYGATLAAVAVGIAPEKYQSRPEIQGSLKMLGGYLTRESANQTLMNRVDLLWASTKLRGLLNRDQQQAIIAEILAKQQTDGGWSSSSLSGSWARRDRTPQETRSDGYATALVALVLEQPGIARENAPLERARAWLMSEQGDDGSWPAYSLNSNERHHISRDTVRFMSDAATAYAVLALTSSDQK